MDQREALKELIASADSQKQVTDELFSKFSVIARKVQVPSKLVGGLSQDEADTVMKFIYFGFRQQPQEAGTLLKFHDAAYQVGGVGSIVRVLTDKKMPKETV